MDPAGCDAAVAPGGHLNVRALGRGFKWPRVHNCSPTTTTTPASVRCACRYDRWIAVEDIPTSIRLATPTTEVVTVVAEVSDSSRPTLHVHLVVCLYFSLIALGLLRLFLRARPTLWRLTRLTTNASVAQIAEVGPTRPYSPGSPGALPCAPSNLPC